MHYEYVYKSGRYESRRRRKFVGRIKSILFVVGAISFGYYITGFSLQLIRQKNHDITVVSPIAEPVTASVDTIRGVLNPSQLPQIVAGALDGTKGTYAVAIKNLKTGESFYKDEDKQFEAASLYKLWVMAEAYREIEAGKLDPQKELDYKIEDLNKKFDIASESAEFTEGVFNMSVKSALNQMIVISHNYAAMSLTSQMGLSSVKRFLKEFEFGRSHLDPPTTSASDIALYYEKLYKGELAGKGSSAEMIETLKRQQLNDRLPKYLPEGVTIAHKTGELDYNKHDAGIVFTPNGDYIIVLMSKSENPQGAAEREALLSKAVYEYFERRN